MVATAFKDPESLGTPGAPLYPAVPATFEWEGTAYPIYDVPTPDGVVHAWALVEPHREDALFIDPANPEAGLIEWEGRWRTLTQQWNFELQFDNFVTAWQTWTSRACSSTRSRSPPCRRSRRCVRDLRRLRLQPLPVPGTQGLFLLMLATIILPFQVTLIPTYAVYLALGWTGTWLPLIVPHLFSNAYNVFLLRQYFLTIPRELDEAAMIDGAGPFRILRSVIIPQAIPAIIAVTLFHFFWAWNEYFLPLVYLQGSPTATAVRRARPVQRDLLDSSPPSSRPPRSSPWRSR